MSQVRGSVAFRYGALCMGNGYGAGNRNMQHSGVSPTLVLNHFSTGALLVKSST